MLRRRGIKFYTSENEDLKAAVVERFNRTLKTKMFRYFTHVNTRRYLDVLDDLLHSYNNTHHRSIGMAPSEVNAEFASACNVNRFAKDIWVTGLKKYLKSATVSRRCR